MTKKSQPRETTNLTSLQEINERAKARQDTGAHKSARRFKLKIVDKMTALTGIMVLIAMTIAGITASLIASNAMENEIQFGGQQMVTSMAGSIATTIRKESAQSELQRTLNKTMREDNEKRIVDAYILGKDFSILAAKDKSKVGLQYTGPIELDGLKGVIVVQNQDDVTPIATPVLWGKTKKRTLGYVVFSFSRSPIAKARWLMMISFATVFIIVIAVTVFATRFIMARQLKPVVRLGRAASEFAKGNYDYELKPLDTGDEIAAATDSFIHMRQANEAFVRFSNPALVEKLVRGEIPDKGEEIKTTVGFGDGRKFTRWSGGHSADETVERLSHYFTLMGYDLRKFGGINEKTMGDGIMFFFPERDPKLRAQQAIKAMLTIQHRISITNAAFVKRGLVPLDFRFGLSTGLCVVGPMGDLFGKQDYTLIGDLINLGARLESAAKKTGLLIDNFTFLNAGGDEFLTHTGEQIINAKGILDDNEKPRDIKAYHVTGLAQEADNNEISEHLLESFKSAHEINHVVGLDDSDRKRFLDLTEGRLVNQELTLPVPLVAT